MTEPVPDPIADALRLRASDADRERVAGLLRDAYAEGRLSHVEHDERLTKTYEATTYADLVPLLAVALRSVRGPEKIAALSALAGASVRNPAVRRAVASSLAPSAALKPVPTKILHPRTLP